ncbi:MAG: hypothetical protein NC225_08315 [Clostridium sp.]|nr:hypothetical protein [Clostridium sp.]MCM1399467.1 hypothetical protein [Clostridium sp.]MCM1460021.1 hypothetical protein [Bacteroides sp.]
MDERHISGAGHCQRSGPEKYFPKADMEFEYKGNCSHSWLREQPFYHAGMSEMEAKEELQYLNRNLDDFYKGNYMPLWKQTVYNTWFK